MPSRHWGTAVRRPLALQIPPRRTPASGRPAIVAGGEEGDLAAVGCPDRSISSADVERQAAEGPRRQLLHPDLGLPRLGPGHGDLRSIGRQRHEREPSLQRGVHRRPAAAAIHPDDSIIAAGLRFVHDDAGRRDSKLDGTVAALLLDVLQHDHGRSGDSPLTRIEPGSQHPAVRAGDRQKAGGDIAGVGSRSQVGHRPRGQVDHADVIRSDRALPQHHQGTATTRQDVRIVMLRHTVAGVRV